MIKERCDRSGEWVHFQGVGFGGGGGGGGSGTVIFSLARLDKVQEELLYYLWRGRGHRCRRWRRCGGSKVLKFLR